MVAEPFTTTKFPINIFQIREKSTTRTKHLKTHRKDRNKRKERRYHIMFNSSSSQNKKRKMDLYLIQLLLASTFSKKTLNAAPTIILTNLLRS